MIEHLMNRIKLLFGMGMVTLAQTKTVQVKHSTGVTNDKIKRVHNFGFMSRPVEGSKAYMLFVGGDVSRGIALAVEDERYEIELEPGEAAMLDDKGNLVHFTGTGIKVISPFSIELTAPTTTITSVTTINGDTTINGQTTLAGKTTATGGMSVDGINFGTHRHAENNNTVTGGPQA
ncbi:MAG: phage baseplate assembly protein V [Thiotrichales bacterium]|jgi:phage baseplate assembly protein V|nr:phage baseplate assembly protein V [Thiotrichales bacterium]